MEEEESVELKRTRAWVTCVENIVFLGCVTTTVLYIATLIYLSNR